MINQQKLLVESLHNSVQHIVSINRLIKAAPPALEAKTIIDYAKLIEKLLLELYNSIPKLCVPISLFKKMEKDCLESNQLFDDYMKEHRRALIEMDLLQQKLKQSEERQHYLQQSYEQIMKNNHYYKKKAQSLKKSGEQGIKHMLEVVSSKQEGREGIGGKSLPKLDKKQRLSLLWLMGPTIDNEKLISHLIDKK